jgi:hypothetical protein
MALLLPVAARDSASQTVLVRFDFGGDYQDVAPGHQPVSRVYRSPRFLWISPVRDQERPETADPLLKDFETGSQGEFRVGLDQGTYRITLVMSDSKEAHGPFTIYLQDRAVREGVRLAPGQVLRLSFPAVAGDGVLRLRFQAAPGQTFAVNGLTIEGPPGGKLRPLFTNAPPDSLPSADAVLKGIPTEPKQALRRSCEWLLAHRLPNGFLGDYERSQTSVSYYWYSSAYPIRTLLAGYEIFHEPRYLDAATRILDRLVEEQLPNGAFAQTYRNKPARELSKAELDRIIERHWLNMADVGSIATALAVSCRYVTGSRREAYLASIRRYCDEWAARWQLPSGAFTNGLESGVAQTRPYSVATGTEAAAFAALFAVTGEPRYLERARRAAEFLLDNWRTDGRPLCSPHWSQNGGRQYVQPVTQFGDILYYHDGILFVYQQCQDPGFRRKVRDVYRWHIDGSHGLQRVIGDRAWFPLQDAWDNSKTAGMPLVFLARYRMDGDAPTGRTLEVLRRFLAAPELSRRIGVMLDDPDLPWGGHSLQSWACCSVAATGFGGMALAEMVRPGVIYLAGDSR